MLRIKEQIQSAAAISKAARRFRLMAPYGSYGSIP